MEFNHYNDILNEQEYLGFTAKVILQNEDAQSFIAIEIDDWIK